MKAFAGPGHVGSFGLRIEHPDVRDAHFEVIGDAPFYALHAILRRENLNAEERWFAQDLLVGKS